MKFATFAFHTSRGENKRIQTDRKGMLIGHIIPGTNPLHLVTIPRGQTQKWSHRQPFAWWILANTSKSMLTGISQKPWKQRLSRPLRAISCQHKVVASGLQRFSGKVGGGHSLKGASQYSETEHLIPSLAKFCQQSTSQRHLMCKSVKWDGKTCGDRVACCHRRHIDL